MTSDSWLPVAAAALGASGAIAAQVVAATFTARREARRLRWDQERHEEESRRARAQQFAADKRELYGRYLRLSYPQIAAAIEYTRSDPPPEGVFLRARRFVDIEPELEQLRWDISLLGAPRVIQAVELSHALLVIVMLQIAAQEEWPREKRHATAREALSRWGEARRAMRADLAGDPLPAPTADQEGETSRSGPTADGEGVREFLESLRQKYSDPDRDERRSDAEEPY
ncbi:hypothetical protein [Cellulosimicrobium sp. 4261]|uniref:hypothetical protein n=1 Tax=Cellulosimicrobium sp. 4261 TaxID=3156458 RepID=UPI00339163FD